MREGDRAHVWICVHMCAYVCRRVHAQVFCKQAAAIHHARAGKSIGGEETRLDEISLFANLAVDGRPLAPQTTSDVSKSSHEGSVFIRFRSLRLRTYKQQVAPYKQHVHRWTPPTSFTAVQIAAARTDDHPIPTPAMSQNKRKKRR